MTMNHKMLCFPNPFSLAFSLQYHPPLSEEWETHASLSGKGLSEIEGDLQRSPGSASPVFSVSASSINEPCREGAEHCEAGNTRELTVGTRPSNLPWADVAVACLCVALVQLKS